MSASTTAAAAAVTAGASAAAAPVAPPFFAAAAASNRDDEYESDTDASLDSAKLLEDFKDDLDQDDIDEEMPGLIPRIRSKHTRMFNEIKRGSKKAAPHTIAEAKATVMEHLETISAGRCKKLRGNTEKKCYCLKILHGNEAYKKAVCESIVQWQTSNHREQQQILLTSHVYAQNAQDLLKQATGKVLQHQFTYKIPFVNEDGQLENAEALKKTGICSYAFCHLYNVGRDRWSKICKLAATSSTVPVHGNTNNKHHALTPEKLEKVHENLRMLEKVAADEPRATRFVRHMNGMTTTTSIRGVGEKDDLYLPATSGYRPTYYRYCADLGYTVRNRGKTTTWEWVGEGDEPEKPLYVSFPKYFYVWKKEYSHLKSQGKVSS
eukprot:scaffold74545_cov56-Cyclotella_meneghiniana.AAC.2